MNFSKCSLTYFSHCVHHCVWLLHLLMRSVWMRRRRVLNYSSIWVPQCVSHWVVYLLCLFKLSFRENNLWQISHSYCFLPVCETQWRIKCSLRLNVLLQLGSSHLNGRKPKCNFKCWAKCSLRLNTLSQISHVGTSVFGASPDVVVAVFVRAIVVVFADVVWMVDALAVVTMMRLGIGFLAVVTLPPAPAVFVTVANLNVCWFAAFLIVGDVSVVLPMPSACSTLTRWNVMAELCGKGCVIFGVATFCSVVKCTLPALVSTVLVCNVWSCVDVFICWIGWCVTVTFCPLLVVNSVLVSGTIWACCRLAVCTFDVCWICWICCGNWICDCTNCGCWFGANEIDVGKLVADVNWTTCWPSTVVSCGCNFIWRYVPGNMTCWSLLPPSFSVIGKRHLLFAE